MSNKSHEAYFTMMRIRKKILLLLIVAIVLSLFTFVLLKSSRDSQKDQVSRLKFMAREGEVAPDFTLPSLKGQWVSLKDYRGKIVFINFWATWCPPCREEMPSMESLYQKLKGHNFVMLGISIDVKGEEVVRPYVKELGLNFTILLDTKNEISRLYGITGVPETFIIDQNGAIIMKIIGPRNWMEKQWLDFFDRITRKTLQ